MDNNKYVLVNEGIIIYQCEASNYSNAFEKFYNVLKEVNPQYTYYDTGVYEIHEYEGQKYRRTYEIFRKALG